MQSPMQRRVVFAELRPECREEYILAHQQVWPELLARYKAAGFRKITCHLFGTTLAVVLEAENLQEVDAALAGDPIDGRWQAWMSSLRPDGNRFEVAETVFEVTL